MSVCSRCAAEFTCAMADQTGQPCWCAQLPLAPQLPIYPELMKDQASCYCPVCMQEWLQKHAQPDQA